MLRIIISPQKISASCGPVRNVGLLTTQQKALLFNFHTLLTIGNQPSDFLMLL